MAGLGLKLNNIYNKRTVTTHLYGILYSLNYTIGPLLSIIGCLLIMYKVLGFSEIGYMERELFSCTVLYIFIFSLLTTSPFNSALQKYMADRIFLDHHDDIRPCFYMGITMSLSLASVIGIPFYLRVLIVGKVPAYYVITSYFGFLGLSLVFSSMIYNLILKHFKKVSKYFYTGMITTFILSVVFRYLIKFSVTYSMLLSMTIGFMLIAIMMISNLLRNFRSSSYNYKAIFSYFRKYWRLCGANFFYILGLFSHNFVFWTLPWHLVLVDSYVCNQPYDMASCVAMFTNISATIIYTSRVEMHFRKSYADYMNSVNGGKLDRIEKTKSQLFRTLSSQMLSLVQMQFVVSVVIFMLVYIFMPVLGLSGMAMQIYPMLAVGYFVSYIMYSAMQYLYYFDDQTGSLIGSAIFLVMSVVCSFIATKLPMIWYGSGFAVAALCAFTYVYFRIRKVEQGLDYHIFCRGSIINQVKEEMPPAEVYRKA